jgi:hypothetical protein
MNAPLPTMATFLKATAAATAIALVVLVVGVLWQRDRDNSARAHDEMVRLQTQADEAHRAASRWQARAQVLQDSVRVDSVEVVRLIKQVQQGPRIEVLVRDTVREVVFREAYDSLATACTGLVTSCSLALAAKDSALVAREQEAARRDSALTAFRQSLPTRRQRVVRDSKLVGWGVVIGVATCFFACPRE